MTTLVARHKRPGGFRKLVNSLETTPPEKRVKILEAMRKEDPDFIGEVENSIFSFEEFANTNDLILCEIIGGIKAEMKALALALYKDEALTAKFMKNMNPQEIRGLRDATESLKQVLAREQTAARFRIITKAREMESAGKFILKKYSTAYGAEG